MDLLKCVTVCRLMNPVDANVHGNVHGGVILNLIEEAGGIIATRYCNQANNNLAKNVEGAHEEHAVAVLARIEHTDFFLPMHIGEVAELMGEIVYTAPHSLEVVVNVWAENILTGTKRKTNKARLWYVSLNLEDTSRPMDVPPMTYSSPQAEERGKRAYSFQKEDRAQTGSSFEMIVRQPSVAFESQEPYTIECSRAHLSFLVGVQDCTIGGYCRGGIILKLMDECAGIVASKHCRGPCVTACLDSINFHNKATKGSLVTVYGQATFTSSRSIEVEVIVEKETFRQDTPDFHKDRAADAFFTYVLIGPDNKACQVPPLQVKTDEERVCFEEGRQRYMRRKLQRQASLELQEDGD